MFLLFSKSFSTYPWCKDWVWVHGTNWDSSGLDCDGLSVNGGRKAFIQSSLEFWYGKFTQEPPVNLFQTCTKTRILKIKSKYNCQYISKNFIYWFSIIPTFKYNRKLFPFKCYFLYDLLYLHVNDCLPFSNQQGKYL